MASAANIHIQNDKLVVTGSLDFADVLDVLKQSYPLLSTCKELHFDLSGVKSSNSAGLSLLLEWVKYAKQHKKAIRFDNIPEKLLRVAKVAGMDSMLIEHVV